MDLTLEKIWGTDNDGSEYTAFVPFTHPSAPYKTLFVMMICDGRPFTLADRKHAQHRLCELKHRLQMSVTRMMDHLGIADEKAFHEITHNPTLMLEAGNHERWTFALVRLTDSAGFFCDWEHDKFSRVRRID